MSVCGKWFIWNPCNCECECDKTCDVGEYLDYENCKCGKKLFDKLADECTEAAEEVKLAKITHSTISINAVLARCTLCYFQYFLQLTSEFVLILFIFIGT